MNARRFGLAAAALVAVLAFLVLRALRHETDASPVLETGPGSSLFRASGTSEGPSPTDPSTRTGGPALRGVVVDGSDRPIQGAEVAAAVLGERVPVRANTGADGRFTLSVGSVETGYLVGVRAAGMAPVLRGNVRPGDGEVRFVLHPGAGLEGLVRDPAGLPCAGARVRAVLRFPGVVDDMGGFETRADEEGRYAFAGLPAVDGSVQATFHDSSSEAAAFSISPGAKLVTRDLRVETGPTIEGTVRAADGTPLPGLTVYAKNLKTKYSSAAESGKDGRFVIRGLDPVPHELQAFDPQGLHECRARPQATPPASDVELGMTPNPEPPAYATFRVVDSQDRPIRNVRLLTYRKDDSAPGGTTSLGADDSGLFRTGRLQEGEFRIGVRGPAGTASSGEFRTTFGRTVDLGTLKLALAARLRGRILDPEGLPASSARVFLGDDPFPEMTTSSSGSFEIEGVPGGTGELRIRRAGCSVLVAPWKAASGETVDIGDLRLQAATGALRGSVRSRSGGAVGGAEVSVYPSGDIGKEVDSRKVVAAADGRFEIVALAAGRWILSANPPVKTTSEGTGNRGADRGGFVSSETSRQVELGEGEQKEVVLEIE